MPRYKYASLQAARRSKPLPPVVRRASGSGRQPDSDEFTGEWPAVRLRLTPLDVYGQRDTWPKGDFDPYA